MRPLAEISIPSAQQCLQVLAPLGALIALLWLMRNADALIRRFLPGLEWHRELGWFNIRAEKRAERVLRALATAGYTLLAAALYGILWGAEGLRDGRNWRDPAVLLELQNHLPVLLLSVALWAAYLLGDLAPRLRREYEEEELEQFRRERAVEIDADEAKTSRLPVAPGKSVRAFRSSR
jgi:hypothetical protein